MAARRRWDIAKKAAEPEFSGNPRRQGDVVLTRSNINKRGVNLTGTRRPNVSEYSMRLFSLALLFSYIGVATLAAGL